MYRNEHTIRQTLSVSAEPTSVPGVFVYLCVLHDQEARTKEEWSGLCLEGNFPSPKLHRPTARTGEGEWFLVDKELLKEISTWGWGGQEDDYACWNTFIETNPYVDVVAPTSDSMQLVLVDTSAHMVFDGNLQPLPVAQRVDYVSWGFDNRTYDLDKAFDILKDNPHVSGLQRSRIPHYNQDAGRDETLSFTWTPDAETYRRAWECCKTLSTEYPSTRFAEATFKLDLFGLRAGGAAKGNTYFGG